MKTIVPEFQSRNSIFEQLDKNKVLLIKLFIPLHSFQLIPRDG